jgi:hypothetical protein
MRSRILLPVVLATTITMLAACGGRSTSPPAAGGESSTVAPSTTSVGSTRSRTAHPALPGASTASSSNPSTKQGETTLPSGPRLGTTPPSRPQPSADPVRFGPVTLSDSTADIAIDPGRTTLTARFSKLEVSVPNAESAAPDATRSFSLVLPLTGAAPNAKLTVHASGFAFADEGATARLTLRVNGRTVVRNFPAGSGDVEYVQPLKLPAIQASACRLSVVLEVHQVPGSHDEKTAFLSVSAIDARIT